MLPERDMAALEDMLSYSREALALAAGRTREALDADRVLCLALQRLLEIVGEAASRVSPETREHLPDLPWRPAIGMRNRLIHGYDMVDADVVWGTLVVDLPPLVTRLEGVLESDPPIT